MTPSARGRSSSPVPSGAGSDSRQSGDRLLLSPGSAAKKLFEGSPANNSAGNKNPFYQVMMFNLFSWTVN